MSKHYVSSEAQCPFYRGEEAKIIFCDGVEPGMTIRLAFGKEAADYKKCYCRKDWHLCKVAKMLWDSVDRDSENL